MDAKPLTVWFAGGVTEAHRTFEDGQALAAALEGQGVECVDGPSAACDLFFCAAFCPPEVPMAVRAAEKEFPAVPVVHYCWDLYPFQVEGNPDRGQGEMWAVYVEDLRRAAVVVVPSQPVVPRIEQYCGGGKVVRVVPTSVRPWEPPDRPTETGLARRPYAYNVMRYYPYDPNRGLLREVCGDLGMDAYEPGGGLGWDEFRDRVLDAAVLVSPYYEASTGGLTLLEGYYHGLPLVLADSPKNGVGGYFPGAREGVFWFAWDNRWEFRRVLEMAVKYGRVGGDLREARRRWVTANYSERRMAAGLAKAFRLAVRTPPDGTR